MMAGGKWYQYKSGVIPKGDPAWCGTRTNHAVTLVGYTPGDVKEDDEVMKVTECRSVFPLDVDKCRNEGEYKWKRDYCCIDKERTVSSSNGFFRVQNSWGSGWGADGYYNAEFDDEGQGTCGMYKHTYRVEPDMNKFTEFEELSDM